jgi:hypothetical protein
MMYVLTLAAMLLLAMTGLSLIARKTVNQPVVDALAHT